MLVGIHGNASVMSKMTASAIVILRVLLYSRVMSDVWWVMGDARVGSFLPRALASLDDNQFKIFPKDVTKTYLCIYYSRSMEIITCIVPIKLLITNNVSTGLNLDCWKESGEGFVLADWGRKDFRLGPFTVEHFLPLWRCCHYHGTVVGMGHASNARQSSRRDLSASECWNLFLIFLTWECLLSC